MAEDSSALTEALYELSSKKPKLVKSHNYEAPADNTIKVTSWKMNEFKYYDVPSPFPTLARGLFTTENADEEEGANVKYRIVVRGYDKFFNIGEVPWTNWHAIERHTTAPYCLTLKSNGCIIFIAALSPDKILVTSKHSLGPVLGQKRSHAQVGEGWLEKHLATAGKTKKQLAQTLWEKKWTAVAELCDDSFEEHVLPIPSDLTGLHLHGLNVNGREFNTQAQPEVDAFATEWGFIRTDSITIDSIREVREFCEEAGKTGKWNGVAVEGFVVRTSIGPRPDEEGHDTPPYSPGSSFFFKVKFDEPYMMYRDWREITKYLLTAKQKGNMANAKISKAKLKRRETVEYKSWVEKEILRNPKAFADYQNNRGIIAVREAFLKWRDTPEGEQVAESMRPATPPPQHGPKSTKTVLVPIAIPGCGKTTIAVALAHLFGFAHTQSDNVRAKKTGDAFHKNVAELLQSHNVVIADRNNHLTVHREGIRDAVKRIRPRPQLVALNWNFANTPKTTVHRVACDRILGRGENHQTLRPGSLARYEDIVWRFIKEAEELDEREVDDVIEMELDESIEDALARAVTGVVDVLGLEKPTDEQMGEALRKAIEYQTDVGKEVGESSKGKEKERSTGKTIAPRFYGILPEIDLEAVMGQVLGAEDAHEGARKMWEMLQRKKRATARPHITITHMKSKDTELALWNASAQLLKEGTPPMFGFEFGHLVWNARVMALTVENLSVKEGSAVEAGYEWLKVLGDGPVRARLHVTIGTADPSIPPVEALQLVEKWKVQELGNVMEVKGIGSQGRLKALVN